MSLGKRLRVDDIISSMPELGPTVPDGGFAWFVMLGILLIQMTVSSVLAMYGVVIEYLAKLNGTNFDLWSEQIILTPILFSAFWSLADPWSMAIVDLAMVPWLIGLIGVSLLSIGIVASGYLATGGVGAYLASLSAGAVMGVGASFAFVQCESTLRKYFRRRLATALTLRNLAISVGLVIVPGATHTLLARHNPQTGLLLISLMFLPTVLGALTLRSPAPQSAAPYSLLRLADEDNEFSINVSEENGTRRRTEDEEQEVEESKQRKVIPSSDPVNRVTSSLEGRGTDDVQPLFEECNNMYAYYGEHDEETDVFVNPSVNTNSMWKGGFRMFRIFRFWISVLVWTGSRIQSLFFFILLPAQYAARVPRVFTDDDVILSLTPGLASFLPGLATVWIVTSSPVNKRIYLGFACLLGSIVLIGMSYAHSYPWFVSCAFAGGISISILGICQDFALFEIFGKKPPCRASVAFFSVVGLLTLSFCFMYSIEFCLRLIASVQLVSGLYWIFMCTKGNKRQENS